MFETYSYILTGNRNYTPLNCKKWIFKINNEGFSFHLIKPVISSLNWYVSKVLEYTDATLRISNQFVCAGTGINWLSVVCV